MLGKLVKGFGGSRRAVGVSVSAFGKHPGERDHFALNPSNSPRLTQVWEMFYERGLKSLVPQWRSMPPEERVEQYAHVFTWRTPEGVVGGRMWSSQDGASPPRKDFPLVVCVECRGMPVKWAVTGALSYLEKVESRCKETASIDVVGTIIRSAEGEIGRWAASAGEAPSDEPSMARLSQAADGPQGMGEQGLARVLYGLSRDLDVMPDRGGKPGRKRLQRAVQLRVPKLGKSAEEACAFWTEFMLNFVTDDTPVLCVAAIEEPWVDVVAGPLAANHLACIRSARARTPMTAEVPYEIDPPFLVACAKLLERGRKEAGWRGEAKEAAGAIPSAEPIVAEPSRIVSASMTDSGPEIPAQVPTAEVSASAPPPEAPPAVDAVRNGEDAPQVTAAKSKVPLLVVGIAVVGIGVAGVMMFGRGGKEQVALDGNSAPSPRPASALSEKSDPPTPADLTNTAAATSVPEPEREPIKSTVAAMPADPRVNWGAPAALASSRREVEELRRRYGQVHQGVLEGLAGVERQVEGVGKLAWTAETRKRVEGEMAGAEDSVRTMDQRVKREARDLAEAHERWRGGLDESLRAGASVDAAWKDAKGAILGSGRPEVEQKAAVEAVKEKLRAVATRIKAEDAGEVGGAAWGKTLGEALADLREGSLREAVKAVSWNAEGAPHGVTLDEQKLAAISQDYPAAVSRSREQAAALSRVERLLGESHTWSERPADGGPGIAELIAKVEGQTPASPALASGFKALVERAHALRAVESEQDSAALLARAEGEGTASAAESLAAWGKVAATPPRVESLEREIAAAGRLKAVLAGVKPESRAQGLTARVSADLRRRWVELLASAKTPADLETLEKCRDAVGVELKDVDPRGRFNLALLRVRKALEEGAGDATGAAVDAFVSELGGSDLPEAAALASRLRAVPRTGQGSAGETASNGPLAPNWRQEVLEGGERVRYTFAARGHDRVLEFVRVEPPAEVGTPFYLSRDEVSVGLVIDLIDAAQAREAAEKWLRPPTQNLAGAWGWRYPSRGRLIPWREWVEPELFMSGASRRPPDASRVYEAEGVPASPPTSDHPMNQLTFEAAEYVAGLAGCRLPTARQWLAAHQRFASQDRDWNLRDYTFGTQYRFGGSYKPDTGSFSWTQGVGASSGATQVWNQALSGGVEGDSTDVYKDGTLWFRPVSEPKDAPCRNLVGNVGEFVTMEVKDEPGAPAVEAAVVGGSALSPAVSFEALSVPVRLKAGESKSKRFPDVGFRLAYTAPAEPWAKRVRSITLSASYVFARQENTSKN